MNGYFPKRDEEPGNLIQKQRNADPGDVSIDGSLTVKGNTRFHGNVIYDTTTTVDVHSSTVYSYGDPILRLNTQYTGTPSIDESGVKIHRSNLPDASLVFREAPLDRNTNNWYIGRTGDMLRVPRLRDDTLINMPLVYLEGGDLVSNGQIVFNIDRITCNDPLEVFSDTRKSIFRHSAPGESALAVEYGDQDQKISSIDIGFKPTTYEGTISASTQLNLVGNSGGVMIQNSLAIDHDVEKVSLSSTKNIAIKGTTTFEADKILASVPFIGPEVNTVISRKRYDYYNDTSVRTTDIPVVVEGSQVIISSGPAKRRTKFEVRTEHTIAVGSGNVYFITIPINIGRIDMVRELNGVIRKIENNSVVVVYSIPNSDIFFAQEQTLNIRLLSMTGTWSMIITVEIADYINGEMYPDGPQIYADNSVINTEGSL